MRFAVRHRTCYRYDVAVSLGPHVVRLSPRPERVRVASHGLEVSPTPTLCRTVLDAYGNPLTELEFGGICHELAIQSHCELDTIPPAELPAGLPLLPWGGSNDPVLGQQVTGDAPLEVYRAQSQVAPTVRAFAEQHAVAAGHAPVAFLDELTRSLYSSFERHIRPSGDAYLPAETLALKRGACRDLALLFIEACRALGIPSRFVSGYQAEAESVDGQRHLHAWPEVFLPEVGFRGWDPTHGLRVADGHVALCAAPNQAETMPVEGGFTFVGERVTSTLDFSLHIATAASAPDTTQEPTL